jgi:hypothetical protein
MSFIEGLRRRSVFSLTCPFSRDTGDQYRLARVVEENGYLDAHARKPDRHEFRWHCENCHYEWSTVQEISKTPN